MSVNQVATFLSVGALLLLACVTAVAVLWALSRVSMRAAGYLDAVAESVRGVGTRLAWGMAVVATLGSLYFSEIAGFPPCELCWYQRIAMYPLAILLGALVVTAEPRVRRLVFPLAIPGGIISAYHYLIQRMPDLEIGECSFTVPCTTAFVWKFDLVSIPFMAFVSFAVIVTVLALDARRGVPTPSPAPAPIEETTP
jgi:disulfide bond formation protein DsbB